MTGLNLNPSAGSLDGREHLLPVRVYYEDTDFTGVVYHANYLRYFERGRSDFLRLIGVGHAELLGLADPTAFVITRMEIDFTRPARIDDALLVRTRYERLRGARLEITQRIERAALGGLPEILCSASVHAACISLDGRARRAPRLLVDKLTPYLA